MNTKTCVYEDFVPKLGWCKPETHRYDILINFLSRFVWALNPDRDEDWFELREIIDLPPKEREVKYVTFKGYRLEVDKRPLPVNRESQEKRWQVRVTLID